MSNKADNFADEGFVCGTGNNESWRAEVASRVSNYKLRHKGASAEEPLTFGPGSISVPAGGFVSAGSPTPRLSRPTAVAAKPFDTNYYRRLNAATLGVSAEYSGAAFVATATARALDMEMPSAEELTAPAIQTQPCPSLPVVDDRLQGASRTVPSQLTESAAAEPFMPLSAAVEVAEPVLSVTESGVLSANEFEPMATEAEAQTETAASNVIVFPSPAAQTEPTASVQLATEELAEPVFASPRILDVPEERLVPNQGELFAGLNFEDAEEIGVLHNRQEDENLVLLDAASVGTRLVAASLDGLLVLGATMAFAAICGHSLADLPHSKLLLPFLAMIPVALWTIYQLLFNFYAGRTVGMELLRLRVSTFDGERPSLRQRRSRALCSLFSEAMAGMGVLWALIDEDGLCWHDRHTRTYIERM